VFFLFADDVLGCIKEYAKGIYQGVVKRMGHVPIRWGFRVAQEGKKWLNLGDVSVASSWVSVIGKSESEDDFLKVASELAKSGQEISTQLIEQALFFNVPVNPELAWLLNGPTRCGFLPWHTKLTEFVRPDHLRNVSANRFLRLIREWANTKQRYGA